jgi:hypothetical protein
LNEQQPFSFVFATRHALLNPLGNFHRLALTHLDVAEEALSLAPADPARLLIQSLTNDPRTDADIKADLLQRWADLVYGQDAGLSFKQVFGREP